MSVFPEVCVCLCCNAPGSVQRRSIYVINPMQSQVLGKPRSLHWEEFPWICVPDIYSHVKPACQNVAEVDPLLQK